ncbi:Zn(II)2Cys6 transcription factor domain-containing protein [Aspergillus homomorphus CBS 101889]|uniref:Zn(2)-C6 fungal-type domain-containing protein n=1 Tax=Aspergillus homomorphus (strain CBS 101889) TaxID=1450537 RepID=A0A395HQ92_ASPHC|nr:hypothetical protein BO97DRAFT_457831 [Aspergillus homomorphus CBS 101889]RAL09603.1 hypothetical protein BO97DRAFT_457831 [Aspergillus homomorphus CBS 101889]
MPRSPRGTRLGRAASLAKLQTSFSRRVKCDEQKPACLQCLTTQRICEGYSNVSQALSTANHLADEDRRAFAFFHSRTVHSIFGEQDASDWITIFLQRGHADSAVRHGLTALASLHESPLGSPGCYVLAPDVTMILCILFVCFEQLRNEDDACVVYLTAGLKLIYWCRLRTGNYNNLKDYSRPVSEFMNGKIIPILQRLRVQFSLCMDSRHSWKAYGISPCLPPPIIPSSYFSFDAARRDFDRAMNYIFSALETNQAVYYDHIKQDPVAILHQWKAASCSRHLLGLYYNTSTVIIGAYHAELETSLDEHANYFQIIGYSLLFSFDLDITPPVFLVASRCRHPDIRRRACQLMLESPFYHGAWRDRYSGLCARRIIEIEEASMLSRQDGSTYVPESGRIRKVSADIHEAKQQIAMHFVRAPFVPAGPVHTTVITLEP